MYHPRNSVARLPADVLLQVGDHLDGKSLARWSMASKGTHSLMNGPHASQHRYTMELARTGLIDGRSGAPHGELAQRLAYYNHSWMSGGLTISHLSLPLAGRHTVYMGNQKTPAGNSFLGTSGGYLYQVTRYHNATYLDLWELPSHRRAGLGSLPPIGKRQFITHHVIQAVAIDPSQNLLVIMDSQVPETCIWFLDLRTFKPHPEAELEDVMPFGDVDGSLVVSQLEICGNTVGVLVAPREGHSCRFPTSTPMRFFLWRSGSLTNIQDVAAPWAFHFLNEWQILIAEFRYGSNGDNMPILRLYDIRYPSARNRGQKLLLPWYGPAYKTRQPTNISFVKNLSPVPSSYHPVQAPFHHDTAAQLMGIKFTFGSYQDERPLDFPQVALCILKASVFTSGNCKDYDWFSQCLAVAPAPGIDLAFAGNRLVSSYHEPKQYLSKIAVQDLTELAAKNHPYPQIWYPSRCDNADKFRVSPFGRIISCVEPRIKKIMPTEDHLILLPDNVNQLTTDPLEVHIVNF
ncbi:hypothetical protein PLEOSDRAFT_152915 [Pleurotus ostreatus PC15]|uniref:F-box domain-containing protein n=1 Tax=Pleurotus ostreatus (strain PC15) TaxID=1137138 RepID=A0A067NZW3_PLEO1|nr:hypothetical protein PLEOSDRAFT_152915 [Pleurotus ostreatus PC15]